MGKYDKQMKVFWKVWLAGLIILVAIFLYQNYLQVQEKQKNIIKENSKQTAAVTIKQFC